MEPSGLNETLKKTTWLELSITDTNLSLPHQEIPLRPSILKGLPYWSVVVSSPRLVLPRYSSVSVRSWIFAAGAEPGRRSTTKDARNTKRNARRSIAGVRLKLSWAVLRYWAGGILSLQFDCTKYEAFRKTPSGNFVGCV